MTTDMTTLYARAANARARLNRTRAHADNTGHAARVAARVAENAATADHHARAIYAAAAVADSRAGDAVADARADARNAVTVRPLAEPLPPDTDFADCPVCRTRYHTGDFSDCPTCAFERGDNK